MLDDVVDPERVATWLERALLALRPDDARPTPPPVPVGVPDRDGWAQVEHSRSVQRPGGAELASMLLDDPVWLRGGDDSVAAALGRIGGHRSAVVALAARRAGRPSPAGYRLAVRAAELASRLDLALVTLVDTAGADPLPLSEQGGIAGAIAVAMDRVLSCPAPTVSVVHGEGGSGGALAVAVTDAVAVTEDAWFAPLGPEGAAATLRTTPQAAADLMGLAPRDLLASGFADALAPSDATAMREWLAAQLDQLRAAPTGDRLTARRERWSHALPGSSPSTPGDSPDIA